PRRPSYAVDARVRSSRGRVGRAAHNAVDRARGRRRAPVGRYVLRDFPAAVVQSWRYVGAAFVLFAVPMVIGYGVIRARPDRAEELVPPVLVSRAEQAAEHQARGVGYAESPKEDLPVIASAIISN